MAGAVGVEEVLQVMGPLICSFAIAKPTDIWRLMLVSKAIRGVLTDDLVVRLLGLRKWLPLSMCGPSIMCILRATAWPKAEQRRQISECREYNNAGGAYERFRCNAFHMAGISFLRMSSLRVCSPKHANQDYALYMTRADGGNGGAERFLELCHIREGLTHGRWIQLQALACLRAHFEKLADNSNVAGGGAQRHVLQLLTSMSDKELLLFLLFVSGLPREGGPEVRRGRLMLSLSQAWDDLQAQLAGGVSQQHKEVGTSLATKRGAAERITAGAASTSSSTSTAPTAAGCEQRAVKIRFRGGPVPCMDGTALAHDAQRHWMEGLFAIEGVYGVLRGAQALSSLSKTLAVVNDFHGGLVPSTSERFWQYARVPFMGGGSPGGERGEAIEPPRKRARAGVGDLFVWHENCPTM